ncbi:tRNA (adenosine(37)-N6)-threonylcarbamoyltransferase complex ATPase subunit type 1 TsaE [bacterium]|nr:tRNA (adenosine(37)-N6)-threonylcarbamoyltransferase complex ATPase subunit type 1 TsaE [bacterium]
MSTEQTLVIKSTSLDNTLEIANNLAKNLKGGEVIELVSDLGGGKTSFVKGLANGIGVKEKVHSPSFTISGEHQGDTLKIYHFDFYRLKELGIMAQELEEILEDKSSVVVIEWADIVEDILPADTLIIHIKVTSENRRNLEIHYNDKNKYLIPRQYLTS